MNPLDPELRYLIRWARATGFPATDSVAPPGFGVRVTARWRAAREEAESRWWGRLQWATVGISAILVAVGIGFWSSQRLDPILAYEVFPVYQIAARSLAP